MMMQPKNMMISRHYGINFHNSRLVRLENGAYKIPEIPLMSLGHIRSIWWDYRLSSTNEELPVFVYWRDVTNYLGEVSKPEINWRSGHTVDPERVCLIAEVLQDAQSFAEFLRLEVVNGRGDAVIQRLADCWDKQIEEAA